MTVTCSNASNIDSSKLTSVTHSGDSCTFRVDPVDTYTGITSFRVTFRSSTGKTITGDIPISVIPASQCLQLGPTSTSRAPRNTVIVTNFIANSAACVQSGGCQINSYDESKITINRFSDIGCLYTITAKPTADLGATGIGFILWVAGTGVGGTHWHTIQADTNLTYTAPTNLSVARGSTLTIDASTYASETANSGYTVSCGDAKNIDTVRLTSVTRGSGANACMYTITPTSNALGIATFTIPYASSSGDTLDAVVSVSIRGAIAFNAPTDLTVVSGSSLTINARDYASDGTLTILCSSATGVSNKFSSVTRIGNTCNYRVTANASAAAGPASFTVPYRSSSGTTLNGTISVTISKLTFTAPPAIALNHTSSVTIDASSYASDGNFAVTCGRVIIAQGVTGLSVTRSDAAGDPCSYTISVAPTAAYQNTAISVSYASAGGHSFNGVIPVSIQPATSEIVFTAPTGLQVLPGQFLSFNASDYVTDNDYYTISCGDPIGVEANKVLVQRLNSGDGCEFRVQPITGLAQNLRGATSFSVLFTSSGGDTHTGTFTVTIGPDSQIAISPAIPEVNVRASRFIYIDARRFASDGPYSITCTGQTYDRRGRGLAASQFTNPSNCIYRFRFSGTTNFYHVLNVTLTSSGGDTGSVAIRLNRSNAGRGNVRFTAPTGLTVPAGQSITIDASQFARETNSANQGFSMFCLAPTDVDSKLTVELTGDCAYKITAGSTAGAASFTARYASTGGGLLSNREHVRTGSVSVTIQPPDHIAFAAPSVAPVLEEGATGSVNAAAYASLASGYTLSCADATGLETSKLASVTHAGSSCVYRVAVREGTYSSAAGADNTASFVANYISSGGSTQTGLITVNIRPQSRIIYSAPAGLVVAPGRSITLDASLYAADGPYTITCGAATGVAASKLSSVSRADATASPCVYTITAASAATEGSTSFSIPLSSSGGATASGAVAVRVGPSASSISVSPANPMVSVRPGRIVYVDASRYATDGIYPITCSSHSSSGQGSLSDFTNPSNCLYRFRLNASPGQQHTLTVNLASAGGATGSVSIRLNRAAFNTGSISFTAPSALSVNTGNSITIDASQYAQEATAAFSVFCLNPARISAAIRVVRTRDCSHTITGITAGTAAFEVRYASTGGGSLVGQEHVRSGVVSVRVNRADEIAFTPPATRPVVQVGSTLVVDAASYATIGSGFTFTCETATAIDAIKLTSVTLQANTCNYTVTPRADAFSSAAGADNTASFTVNYRGSGGFTRRGVITVEIAPSVGFTAPSGLSVGRNRTLTINALDHYNARLGQAVTCGDATGVDNTKLTSVTRTSGTCTFTVDPIDNLAASAQGNTTFSVAYSANGSTVTGTFTVNIGPDSNLVVAPPTDPKALEVGRNRTRGFNALDFATENTGHTVTCGDATGVDAAKLEVKRNGCAFTIDPIDDLAEALQGNTSFSVPFISTGGQTIAGAFTAYIGPDSVIRLLKETPLRLARNNTLTIDATDYVGDGDYTVSCGDPYHVNTAVFTVRRIASGNGCSIVIDPRDDLVITGDSVSTGFTVWHSSSGGFANPFWYVVFIYPDSEAVVSPSVPYVAARSDRLVYIDASRFVSDGNNSIVCEANPAYDARGRGSAPSEITNPSNCLYGFRFTGATGHYHDLTVDFSSFLEGTASQVASSPPIVRGYVTVIGRSVGEGRVLADSGSLTIRLIRNDAGTGNIRFTAPDDLTMSSGASITVDAAGYAQESRYSFFCLDPNAVDSKITVVRTSDCNYRITAAETTGTASFNARYASTGGGTDAGTEYVEQGRITITITSSGIVFSPPAVNPSAPVNASTVIDASAYATAASGITISCEDATNIDTSKLLSVTRAPDTCNYTVTPKPDAYSFAGGDNTATFTVNLRGTGGLIQTGVITVDLLPLFRASVAVGRNRTKVVDALESWSNISGYTLTCADATEIDATRLVSATRGTGANACKFTVDPIDDLAESLQGETSFSVVFSSGGRTIATGTFLVNIGPDSNIIFEQPWPLVTRQGGTQDITIGERNWATDGDYELTCSEATGFDTSVITRVTQRGDSCNFDATFATLTTTAETRVSTTITSSGGATLVASVRMINTDYYPGISDVRDQGWPAQRSVARNRKHHI